MFERAIEWWFRWVMVLPLTLLAESKHRVVRLVAFPAFLVWFPVFGLACFFALGLLAGDIIETLWREPL